MSKIAAASVGGDIAAVVLVAAGTGKYTSCDVKGGDKYGDNVGEEDENEDDGAAATGAWRENSDWSDRVVGAKV